MIFYQNFSHLNSGKVLTDLSPKDTPSDLQNLSNG